MTTAFLHGLRMLGDLLIYGAFASFFAACLGGGSVPLLLLLPAFCYGVSACLSQRRILRTGCAAISLLGLLALGWMDRAAFLPTVFYALYLAWKGDYPISAGSRMCSFCSARFTLSLPRPLASSGTLTPCLRFRCLWPSGPLSCKSF